ncbi:MAG: hypothetical protein JW939_02355 [Candidatus Thermoplasmatota archaeon]|nr:hypothetical protein [Candidatus Thermoplasmatota archaeon]
MVKYELRDGCPIHMVNDPKEISETAPSFSLPRIFGTIREKGFLGALDDPEQGPHVHLTVLLATVFVVSVLIILITEFII